MNKRICEKCEGIYATGKSYGNWWQQFDLFGIYKHLETKGLCEYCNHQTYEYAVKHNEVCTTLVCNNCDRFNIQSGDICNKTTKEEKEEIYNKRNYTTFDYLKWKND